ncbi:OmpH family outer membrane protein [Litoreibacter roseus]|uniref:Periplasmic chaperone for outer membrane proteins Skp n=1 Tax=Litoreibacter roseus TaxID=2601869 RepID=A0A6N6JKI2_9RHOB|nr:OmpH family outer membrane protein [Litoreibacter roseus]GFE66826.1 hypothetical protein KIN_39000 [Litoreibacter roseus]
MWRAALLLILLLAPALGVAQEATQSPVLTLDQERLFESSAFGQRALADLQKARQELRAENARIQEDLITEEERLRDERPTLEPAAFQKLAADFDERVTAIRAAQDEKGTTILGTLETEKQRFFELAFPVLFELVEETGAVAILNDQAVIFSVRQIDITEAAIARVNQRIGAAPRPLDPRQSPRPRPQPETEPAEAGAPAPLPMPDTESESD